MMMLLIWLWPEAEFQILSFFFFFKTVAPFDLMQQNFVLKLTIFFVKSYIIWVS